MGNIQSVEKDLFSVDLEKCYICKKNIEEVKDLVKCLKCKINLHFECEEKYRNDENYCSCPNCYKIGTLGIKY
jgi:hemerythrin